jgi:hypothetical protein
MADDLRAFVQHASEAAEVFFRPDGQMLAYFLAENREGKHTIIAYQIHNGNEEITFRKLVPIKLREEEFVRWCFFTEAWIASYEPGQSPVAIMPKERSDRMEVVTFFAEVAATGETLFAHRQIYRDGSAPAKLMPLVFARERTAFVVDQQKSVEQ